MVFEKHRVAFSRKEIFGNQFKPNVNLCFCTVSKMLFDDKINVDGTVDINKAVSLKKEELWSYVYYLYFYNHTNVPIFRAMTNPENGKASADLFYSTVTTMIERDDVDEGKPAPPFDTATLIIFINNVLEEFGKELINPIFDYLHVLLQKNVLTRISGITIKTGEADPSNPTANQIKIVTNAANVSNANVKVQLSVNDDNTKKN